VQLKTTLGNLNTTLGVASPSLDVLKPVAPLLKPALVNLTEVSSPLLRLLRTAPAVLEEAKRALPTVTKFVNSLKPAADALLPAAQQLVPAINIVGDYRPQLVDGMVNLAAILNARGSANTTTDSDGIPAGQATYLRQVLSLGPDSTYGATTRSTAERSNTYFAPGALDGIGTTGEQASSCAGSGPSGNVACSLQPSYTWGHGIAPSYYPHVTAAKP
jgi:hypothetical protein